MNKIKNNENNSMKIIVSSSAPYGFEGIFFEENKQLNCISSFEYNILVYGLLKNKRTTRFISSKDLIKNIDSLKKYKVFIPRAHGGPSILGKLILGYPFQICTATFLEIGPFNTEVEAISCFRYIKTKFFRALVSAKKAGVFNYKDAFKFVPIQDFTNNSDIDWTKSIPEIDKQLYKKYDLTQDEINFIESKIKPME